MLIDPFPSLTKIILHLDSLYSFFLNRAADPSGEDFWGKLIDQGVSRSLVALSFENSAEGRAALVQSFYQTYLHRAADPGGLQFGVNFLGAGGTDEQLKATFLASDEYDAKSAGGTDDGFVQALFSSVLGRAVDPPTRAFLDQALGQGVARETIAYEVLVSPEAEQALIQHYFSLYLNRHADPAAVQFFSQSMQLGASDEAVIAAIVGSDEFFNGH